MKSLDWSSAVRNLIFGTFIVLVLLIAYSFLHWDPPDNLVRIRYEARIAYSGWKDTYKGKVDIQKFEAFKSSSVYRMLQTRWRSEGYELALTSEAEKCFVVVSGSRLEKPTRFRLNGSESRRGSR